MTLSRENRPVSLAFCLLVSLLSLSLPLVDATDVAGSGVLYLTEANLFMTCDDNNAGWNML